MIKILNMFRINFNKVETLIWVYLNNNKNNELELRILKAYVLIVKSRSILLYLGEKTIKN